MIGLAKAVKKGARRTADTFNTMRFLFSSGAGVFILFVFMLGFKVILKGTPKAFEMLKDTLLILDPLTWIVGAVMAGVIIVQLTRLSKQKKDLNKLTKELSRAKNSTSVGNNDFTMQVDIMTRKVDLLLHPEGEEIARLDDYTDREIAKFFENKRIPHLLTSRISEKSVDFMLSVFQYHDLHDSKLLLLNLKKRVREFEQGQAIAYESGEDDAVTAGVWHFAPEVREK